jgi:hypothetical protein
MRKLLTVLAFLASFATSALAATATVSVIYNPGVTGAFGMFYVTSQGIAYYTPSYSSTDAAALALMTGYMEPAQANNPAASAPVTFTSDNPVLAWPGNGLSANQPVNFTGSVPSNFSNAPTQVYYAISAGLGTNTVEVSTTPGGAVLTPANSAVGVGFNELETFYGFSNALFLGMNVGYQHNLTTQSIPSLLAITPNQ